MRAKLWHHANPPLWCFEKDVAEKVRRERKRPSSFFNLRAIIPQASNSIFSLWSSTISEWAAMQQECQKWVNMALISQIQIRATS